MKGFFKEAQLKQRRTETRVGLVGGDGVNIQDARRRAAEKAGPQAVSRDVQKRMKEYRTGVIDNSTREKVRD